MLAAVHLFFSEIPGPIDLKAQAIPAANNGYLRDILLITGVAAVFALTLFLYVYMTRRNNRSHSPTGARAIYRAEKRAAEERDDESEGRHRVRRRRRRKEEFSQRNPTLGETGGLPPIRTEEPAEPAS